MRLFLTLQINIKMKKILLLTFALSLLTNIFAQIPSGYYDSAIGLEGDALKSALHDIIDNHNEPSYDDLRDFILKESDEDPNNSNNVILLYTGRSQSKSSFGGDPNDWNREHVWAKSHGDFGNNPPCGTDAHHIRPTDASVNSDRGDKDFDNGGNQHGEATACYYTSTTWEPRDEVKGDVARMMFYMVVRYEGDNGELDLELVDYTNTSGPKFGKLSTLRDWHAQDPPDAFEENRNNIVHDYQNNRNPFIDHPEWVECVWGDNCGTSINNFSEIKISFFPNPTNNKITIVSRNNIQSVNLYDICGKNVFNIICKNNNEITVNISHLPKGIYITEIIDTNNNKILKKLIKE